MRKRRSTDCFGLNQLRLFVLALFCIGSPCYMFPMPEERAIALDPQIGHLGPLRTPTLWQLPEGRARKVLLILGALGSVPYDWWDRSPNCLLCNGLPENRWIVHEALSKHYAVVMPHSLVADGDWSDWPEDSPDIVNIQSIILEWKVSQGLDHVPTVALGASAGGRCLCALGLQPGLFESMVHMISPGRLEAWGAATSDYPPTFFIHMPKDTLKAEGIQVARIMLEANGVPTGEVPWYEQRLTPNWFSQSIVGMNLVTSKAIYNALKANESIVGEDDFLKTDQFEYVWDNILPPDYVNVGQLLFEGSVWQEVKVAFARHVTIARRNREMFLWFEGAYTMAKKGWTKSC